MFRQLLNSSYQRTALQAVGWYLTFILIGNFIAGGVMLILAMASFKPFDVDAVNLLTFLIIPAYYIMLAYALVRSRLTRLNIVLAVLAPLLFLGLAVWTVPFLGTIGGLIPLALLTTRSRHKSPAEIGEVFK